MKFILKSQANAEARADRADARMDKNEKKAEREMAAIRKLLHQGMKSLAELAESQKETDRALKAFIKNQGNGRRGNGKNSGLGNADPSGTTSRRVAACSMSKIRKVICTSRACPSGCDGAVGTAVSCFVGGAAT